MILDALRKRMYDAGSDRVEQLYYSMWGIRTIVQSSTGETPFRMTYGNEAMIPVEVGLQSWRRKQILQEGEEANNQALLMESALVDEVRVKAHARDLRMKRQVVMSYNKKVVPRQFNVNDLVLRRADIGNKNAREGKLAINWEGPYRVTHKLDKGTYKLETLEGRPLKRTWNADKLKVFYS